MIRHVLLIGHNDFRLFLKSKVSYVWLFIMPLMFVYFMGFANRGSSGPANPNPPVMVDNQDTNFLSRMFLLEMGAQGMWVLSPTNADRAERGIRIAKDFTSRILEGEQAKVEFFEIEGSGMGEAAMIELRVVRALISMNSHLVRAAERVGAGQAVTETSFLDAMSASSLVRLDASFAGRKPIPSGFRFSLPGNLVMYVMMNVLVFGGAALASERSRGLLRRFAGCPIGGHTLVAGKVYGLLLLGVVQIVVLLAGGRFLFQVPIGGSLPTLLLLLAVYAWGAAALGVFLGSVIRSEEKVIGTCVLVSLLMAALGGCWWPLEIAPPALQVAAHCLPTGWAMEGLHHLISFGGGWSEAKGIIGVLVLYALVFSWMAGRFFRA